MKRLMPKSAMIIALPTSDGRYSNTLSSMVHVAKVQSVRSDIAVLLGRETGRRWQLCREILVLEG